MTRKQIALLIGANAVISTLITLLLVLVILPAAGVQQLASAPTATVASPDQQPSPAGSGPTPSATPVLHTVRSGDTISGLALEYDVPEEDIISANQLQNPNLLQVGTKLVIPVGGFQPATPTWTAVPTASDTPLPFNPPSADMTATAVAAVGVTASPPLTAAATVPITGELQVEITEVVGAGQVDQEQVVITNEGARLADMQGWILSDGEGNTYTFPNLRLWPGGNVILHTGVGQDGNPPNNFYWKKLVAMWSPREVVTLKDAAGAVIATYTVAP